MAPRGPELWASLTPRGPEVALFICLAQRRKEVGAPRGPEVEAPRGLEVDAPRGPEVKVCC